MPKKQNKTKKNKIRKRKNKQRAKKAGTFRKTFRNSDNNTNNSSITTLPFQEYGDYIIGNSIDNPGSKTYFNLGPKIIKNYYEIKLLGKGAFGSVFKSRKSGYDTKQYVVKVSNTTSKSYEFIFYNECNILKHLKDSCNKFIVCYVEAFENFNQKTNEKHGYIVLENLEGYIDLDLFIKTDKMKKIIENYYTEKINSPLVKIFSNLLEGIYIMHNKNVVHRDIKCENIMIHPETYNIKYIDFGLSCLYNDSQFFCTKPIGTAGTFDPILFIYYNKTQLLDEYITLPDSEKSYLNQEYLMKSDLWSVGIVFCYILLQNAPYNYIVSYYNSYNIDYLLTKVPQKFANIIKSRHLFLLYPFYSTNVLLKNSLMEKPIKICKDIVSTIGSLPQNKTYFCAELENLVNLNIDKRTMYIPENI